MGDAGRERSRASPPGELAKIGIIDRRDVRRRPVIRVPEDLPGLLRHLRAVRRDAATTSTGFPNLFLVGRNGMHRYNNQDHSMLTAMTAVETIVAGSVDKASIWAVNVDDEYHEEKQA